MMNQMSPKGAARLRGIEAARGLCSFITESPTAYHAVAATRRRLDAAGFRYLPENSSWTDAVKAGGSYYTVRNNSSLIAWRVGEDMAAGYHFQIAAAHGDSPTFKLKDFAEAVDADGYLRLDVEAYGSAIDYTWFDRPLTLAGRVLVRTGSCVSSRLVYFDRDFAIIPSLSIHLNRSVNEGFAPSRVLDVCPLVSAGELGEGAIARQVAQVVNADPEQILGMDLFLVNRQAPVLAGPARELICAPRLDDLMCAYTALQGFLTARNEACVTVYACFDNEEVGSGTKQGALSTFMPDTLARLNAALGGSQDDLCRALASSMLVSCDNAQAVAPGHADLYDAHNRAHLNQGIVIKEAARQSYCTDAFSRALFCGILQRADIPYQIFANRSDQRGGFTLGNLLARQLGIHSVDVGCAQLAMHSSYETAGVHDVAAAERALEAFYATDIQISGADAALFVER